MLLNLSKLENGTIAVVAPQQYREIVPATFGNEDEAHQWLMEQGALCMVDRRNAHDVVSGTYDIPTDGR